MKLSRTLPSLLFFLFFSFFAKAQFPLAPYPLQVGERKTSNIIFPYAIRSIDRGSRDILARTATGAENILQVKAATGNFAATNLSVITADGKLYSFLVSYDPDPRLLTISFARDSLARFEKDSLNDEVLALQANAVIEQKKFLYRHSASDKMQLTLERIYISSQVLWFTFKIENHSQVAYEPDYIKFFITDKHKARRTAMQETEAAPLFRLPMDVIKGHDQKEMLFGFAPFTIAKGKKLKLVISEKNGGRMLELNIKNNSILKARALNGKQ